MELPLYSKETELTPYLFSTGIENIKCANTPIIDHIIYMRALARDVEELGLESYIYKMCRYTEKSCNAWIPALKLQERVLELEQPQQQQQQQGVIAQIRYSILVILMLLYALVIRV